MARVAVTAGSTPFRDKALWIAVLTIEVRTVFLSVLGHNGGSLKDAIGANSTLHHRALSFGEEVRWHATEKDRERCGCRQSSRNDR